MSAPGNPAEDGATVSPWTGTGPELVIAGAMILVAAAAGYLVAGWAGLSVAVTAGAAVAMVVLRYLLPTLTPDAARKAREKPQARMLSGYSHRRFVVRSSIASRASTRASSGRVLEHLLPPGWPNATACTCTRTRTRPGGCSAAVRARRRPVAVDRPGYRPETPASKGGTEPGIPRRTLARLIDRLEHL